MSTGPGTRHKYTMETALEAIKGSGAIISTVAKRLGCGWMTARATIEKWDETKRAFSDEQETILDMAESKLYESIQNGNTQDAKWLLSTKGKNRGYSERKEITGADGDPVMLKVNWIGKGG